MDHWQFWVVCAVVFLSLEFFYQKGFFFFLGLAGLITAGMQKMSYLKTNGSLVVSFLTFSTLGLVLIRRSLRRIIENASSVQNIDEYTAATERGEGP